MYSLATQGLGRCGTYLLELCGKLLLIDSQKGVIGTYLCSQSIRPCMFRYKIRKLLHIFYVLGIQTTDQGHMLYSGGTYVCTSAVQIEDRPPRIPHPGIFTVLCRQVFGITVHVAQATYRISLRPVCTPRVRSDCTLGSEQDRAREDQTFIYIYIYINRRGARGGLGNKQPEF